MVVEEEFDDAELCLPSHFLTDDDILMDFSPPTTHSSFGSGSGSGSDIDLPSNGSLTDDDESLSDLTRHFASSVIKGWNNMSRSPQSTLCGWVGKEEGSSSRDSTNVPVSPRSSTDKEGGATTTLDLLNKAAGEVARFQTTTTTTSSSSRAGTGFFDCSSKRQFCPPPSPSPLCTPTTTCLPYFPLLHFPPPLSHVQQQMSMRQQQMIIRNKSKEQKSKNQPLGLPQTAWPPLQAQNQPIQRGPQMFMGHPGPKRECVGTGVFLPRRVDIPVVTRNKSEGGNPTKTRNGKNNNKGSNSNRQRSGSRQSASNSTEIRLPLEWTY